MHAMKRVPRCRLIFSHFVVATYLLQISISKSWHLQSIPLFCVLGFFWIFWKLHIQAQDKSVLKKGQFRVNFLYFLQNSVFCGNHARNRKYWAKSAKSAQFFGISWKFWIFFLNSANSMAKKTNLNILKIWNSAPCPRVLKKNQEFRFKNFPMFCKFCSAVFTCSAFSVKKFFTYSAFMLLFSRYWKVEQLNLIQHKMTTARNLSFLIKFQAKICILRVNFQAILCILWCWEAPCSAISMANGQKVQKIVLILFCLF